MSELTDSEKLRVLAAWFDMWDRPETDRQRVLDDSRNPAHNDVQLDLLRIADDIEARASQPLTLDVERLRRVLMDRDLVVLDTRDYGGMRMSDTAAATAIADDYNAVVSSGADFARESRP